MVYLAVLLSTLHIAVRRRAENVWKAAVMLCRWLVLDGTATETESTAGKNVGMTCLALAEDVLMPHHFSLAENVHMTSVLVEWFAAAKVGTPCEKYMKIFFTSVTDSYVVFYYYQVFLQQILQRAQSQGDVSWCSNHIVIGAHWLWCHISCHASFFMSGHSLLVCMLLSSMHWLPGCIWW